MAVVDSGIQPVEDLKTVLPSGSTGDFRIVATKDFIEDGNTSPKDPCGHGTHIAGIIAGSGYSSTGKDYKRKIQGIAPAAQLVNVRVLDEQGSGSVSDVIAGLQWIVANKDVYKIRIANLSLGHQISESYTTDPLCQAVEQVWKAGIIVVCSAGNNGRFNTTVNPNYVNEGYGTKYGSVLSPGNSPYVITVGAMKTTTALPPLYNPVTRSQDTIASYSGRGPSAGDLILKPDLVAPGNRIISLQPNGGYLHDEVPQNQIPKSWYMKNQDSQSRSDVYYVLSGSSLAAPVVAGAAALLLERNPTLTPDTVKARLMLSADKWSNPDGTTDPFTYGAGYINIPAALRSTVTAQGYALSPKVTVAGEGLRIGQEPDTWLNGSFWGTQLTDLTALWGNAVYASGVIADASATQVAGNILFVWGGGTDGRKNPMPRLVDGNILFVWGGGTDRRKNPIAQPVAGNILFVWGGGTDGRGSTPQQPRADLSSLAFIGE